MQAVKQGKRVVVVERFRQIGGGCTHWGTIPSKALRYAIFQTSDVNRSPLFRGVSINLTFPQLRASAATVIGRQVDMRQGFYDRNGVEIVQGEARFLDPQTIEVREPDGGKRRLTSNSIIIATGSRPYQPDDVDFSHSRIFDSDGILQLDHTPRSISIVGAGVVGCEYASMFRNLGVKVNLINSRDQLLSFLDDEIIDALSYHLRENGVVIRHRETYSRIEGLNDGVVVHLNSGKQIKTDVVLMAIGRSGNTNELGIDKLGIEPDKRGNVKVTDDFQTDEHPHIYAVGDVIGYPGSRERSVCAGALRCQPLVHRRSRSSTRPGDSNRNLHITRDQLGRANRTGTH